MAYVPQMYIPPTINNPAFHGNNDNRYSVNGINIPWKPLVLLPKVRVPQRPTKFTISANSNKIVLAPTINNLNSSRLSPYQPQQQQYNTYHYKTEHFPSANIPSSRIQGYQVVQQATRYYNPLDPFGVFNNPFWKSVFPNYFVPQPQIFISTTPQPAQSLVSQQSQQKLTSIPKKSTLSPDQKFALCCSKQNLSPSCQLICNYDTISDRSLINAVIFNQCPGNQLETAFNCATSMVDHSACCIRNGIETFKNGHCMVFCTTHRGNPRNIMQYLDCLQVFNRIKSCYREYHVVNPNIYGDL
ncbi:unnamed protein product [Onchocerca ochengi]|uniref:DB domain-containing protein n=1 Tax=Onchocerca ochengi TaxID=42157 RepID=A0A182E946_ONCOC|nr:unnamed protein product [Onchocerca ochengi]